MAATGDKRTPPRRYSAKAHAKAAEVGTLDGMFHHILTDTWETGECAFTAPQARTLDSMFYGLLAYLSVTSEGLKERARLLEALVELLVTDGTISREALKTQFETALARDAVDAALSPAFQQAQQSLQKLLRRNKRERNRRG